MHRSPAPIGAGPLTLEEFEQLPELDARLKLSKGLLVREPQPEARHGAVVVNVLRALDAVSRHLAVEVVSPSNTAADMQEKVLQYLAAGTDIVWVVQPRTRTVEVWRPGPDVQVLRQDDRLEGEGVLPGFGLIVHELFAV